MQKLLLSVALLATLAGVKAQNPILFSAYGCTGPTGNDYYQAYHLSCAAPPAKTIDYNINPVGQVGIGTANIPGLYPGLPLDLFINTHGWPSGVSYNGIILSVDDNGAPLFMVANTGNPTNPGGSLITYGNSNTTSPYFPALAVYDLAGHLTPPILAASGTGAIGMGTSSPEAQLDINNNTYVSGSSLDYLLHVGDASISKNYLTVSNSSDVEVGIGVLPTGSSTLALKGGSGTLLDLIETDNLGGMRWIASNGDVRHVMYDDVGLSNDLVIWTGISGGAANKLKVVGSAYVTNNLGIGMNMNGTSALELKSVPVLQNQWGNALKIYETGALAKDGMITFYEPNGIAPRHIISDDIQDSMLTITPGLSSATLPWVNIEGGLVIGDGSLLRRNTTQLSTQYGLVVQLGLLTQRIKVVLPQGDWSDYVFDKNYPLLKIDSVENYIKQNKHLPDIPSACEVAEDGIDMQQMDALLLKKIEELTLYSIQTEKRIKQLEAENAEIKDELVKFNGNKK